MYFFIIKDGRCEVTVNDNPVNYLQTGISFGELAMLHDTKRTATVRTITSCEMWVIDRRSFKQAIQNVCNQTYEATADFVDKIALFNLLTEFQKDQLIRSLIE